jgi:uncharacterized SAM-dependent methyltransferase
LNADFDIDQYIHHAFYNEDLGRIEMHIKSLRDQTVSIGEDKIHFTKGETIHTENSYKYSIDEFTSIARESGFTVTDVWTDSKEWFSVQYLEAT